MSEDFIHFIWKFRQFSQRGLKTVAGEKLEIISPGVYNNNAGPDFFDVKIRIGTTLWAGNAEVHICSSDWEKHGHGTDKAYNNVVLHVVYCYDKLVLRSDGTAPPTLELRDYIVSDIQDRYQALIQNQCWIPCEKQIAQMDGVHIHNWLFRVLVERLEEKSEQVCKLADEYKGSWEDTFYIMLARNFGFKVNALPFELLARSLPQNILAKHKNNPLQIEALILGQAGFLEKAVAEPYFGALSGEYAFLRNKYRLQPVESFLWKFMRLRPQNFPTLRLAQFAALILKSGHLFSKVIELSDMKRLRNLFSDLPVNPYWKTHYRPGKHTAQVQCQLGAEAVNNILLNTVAVTVFSYGKYTGNEAMTERAIQIIEDLPFEINHITKQFKAAGVTGNHSGTSQALLQLKKSWCDQKKCLNCAVGVRILNSA